MFLFSEMMMMLGGGVDLFDVLIIYLCMEGWVVVI